MDIFEMDVTEQVKGIEAWVGTIKLVRPCHFSCHRAAVDIRASCVCIQQFRKKWWIDDWNSAALSLPSQYQASWEHSKLQYHLEVGHIFSNKRNNNEEETTWSYRNCMNPGEHGKSERGHREESNPFCSATCCRIRNFSYINSLKWHVITSFHDNK